MSWWYHLREGQCRPLPGGPYIPRVFEDPTCGGTGSVSVTWDDIVGKPLTFPPEAHTHPWDEIVDKPACFDPCAHTHLWADITDKPECFEPCEHLHDWEEIENKPECFEPCEHTHDEFIRHRGLLDGGTVYNAVPHRIVAPPPTDPADIGVTALDGGTP